LANEQQREWHLDRRVTISLILALAAQVAVMGYWAAETRIAIEQNTANIARLDKRQDDLRILIPGRLAAIDTRLLEIVRRLDRNEQRNSGNPR